MERHEFDRQIAEWKIRQRILELDVDKFFARLDRWSRILAWLAIAGGLVILAKMIAGVMK